MRSPLLFYGGLMGKSPLQQIINKYKIMKADDLVSAARSGDADAACELARRLYNFPKLFHDVHRVIGRTDHTQNRVVSRK